MKIETNHTVVLAKEEIKKLLYSALEEKLSAKNLNLPEDYSLYWKDNSEAVIITWVEK